MFDPNVVLGNDCCWDTSFLAWWPSPGAIRSERVSIEGRVSQPRAIGPVEESLRIDGVEGDIGFGDAFPRGMIDDIPPRSMVGP